MQWLGNSGHQRQGSAEQLKMQDRNGGIYVGTNAGLDLDSLIRPEPKELRGPLMYIEALDWKLPGIAQVDSS